MPKLPISWRGMDGKVKTPGVLMRALIWSNSTMLALFVGLAFTIFSPEFHERFFAAMHAALDKLKWW